jgi:hypothetical protein
MKRWSFLPLGSISPWWWVPAAIGLVAVDYATGPFFQFPSVYILFVVGASWFSGMPTGVALAIALPLSRAVLMTAVWDEPWDSLIFVATAITRTSVSLVMAVLTARLAAHERSMVHEVEVLTSLLPVCTDCRRIRRTDDRWTTLEAYAAEAPPEFATGLCPDCATSRFPEYAPVTEPRRDDQYTAGEAP